MPECVGRGTWVSLYSPVGGCVWGRPCHSQGAPLESRAPPPRVPPPLASAEGGLAKFGGFFFTGARVRGSFPVCVRTAEYAMLSSGFQWSCNHRVLLGTGLVALLVCISHVPTVASEPQTQSGGEARTPEFLHRVSRTARDMLVYVLGEDSVRSVTEVLSSLIWIICSGISTSLITIAGIVQQLLDAVGLDGKQISGVLAASPEQVQRILLWAALAFVAYWMLSLVLGTVLSLLGRLLWGLKVALFVLAFFYLVNGISDPHLLATSLVGLVALYAFLGWLSGRGNGGRLEAKVQRLERQVEDLRMKQKRASKKDDN